MAGRKRRRNSFEGPIPFFFSFSKGKERQVNKELYKNRLLPLMGRGGALILASDREN